MNIYLDSYFGYVATAVNLRFNILQQDQFDYELDWIDTLPSNIDILGISFYTNKTETHKQIIDLIKHKAKFILVNFSEPTSTSFLSLGRNQPKSNIFLFSDVVVNAPHSIFETNISWFISPTNPYKNNLEGEQILNSIKPIKSNRQYIFDCLLGRENINRNFIANKYESSQLNNKFFYTYYKEDKTNYYPTWQKEISLGNYIISSDQLIPVDIYNNSYYSIVAETTFSNLYNQYTEKVAKPILAKRPFIAFCGRHYLKNLRSLGFSTFHKVIDESYDEIEVDHLRWEAAWQQVEILSEKDPERVYSNLRHKLQRNYEHFLNNDWQLSIKEIMLNLVHNQQLGL